MKEIIYVYTTPTYKLKSWFKIGMTNQGSGSIRISQQDGTSNPERLEKQYEMDISGETELSAYEVEQKIHRFYERLGKRVRDNREWFEVEGGVEEIKRVIESILDNSDLHKSEIKLKPHQIEANTKINECFNSDDKRCLLAHKPRSGKTFTTIYNIKENNYKNVVILTSYPILNFQWEEVILGFKGFSNTEIIIGSGLDKIELNSDKNSIVLLSLQDVKGGEEVFEKEKFDLIKDIEFDLLVIDEVHTHVETEKTQDFLSKIKYQRMLGLSATPTRNILAGRFSKEQIHNYTLVEEVKLKKQYPELYPYADINFLIWNLSGGEKSELKYFSDEEQFKFDKFFRIEGDNFYYKSDIVYLFKKLAGDRDICRRDKLGTTYPFKNNGDFSVIKSILLFVPNISVQYKLKELLSELESYDDFNIHITNSNEYSSNQLIKRIRREFKSGDKRSIILAVDQLTTGITLDDCDMVVLMNDWRSVDKYVQASFRCQSPREGKENCWVLDFNAARSFELMWEYQNIISKNNGKSLTENISEWVECVNIFNRVDGELIKVDLDSFNTEYNKSVLERPRFNYQSVILQDKLGHDNISKALMAIGIKGGSSSSDEDLNDDGIDKGKSKKSEKKSGGKGKVDEGISQIKLMEIAKALVDKTMLLSIFTYFKFDNVDDCFNALENDNSVVDGIGELERKMYLETLLLGMNDVDKVNLGVIKFIYDNIFDKEIINKKLYLFNHSINLMYNSIRENPEIIDIMLANLTELIDSYLKPSNTEKKMLGEVFTSLELVEQILDKLPDNVWSNPEIKFLDPANGIGNFPVILVKKLMNGLKEWQPDSELRLKHILENQIYICEFQSKNMFIYLQLFDPENKYKLNFHKGSFLDDDFLNIMKKWDIDKFDIIVGNPPYNDGNKKNFYIDFFIRSFDLVNKSGYINFITPSRYTIQPEFSKFREKVEDNSKCVLLENKGRAFGEGASFTVVITMISVGTGCSVDWVNGFGDPIVRKFLSVKNKRLLTNRSKAILKDKEERDSYSDIKTNENQYLYFVNSKGKGKYETPFRYLNGKQGTTFVPKIVMTEFVGTGNKKTLGNLYIDYNGDWGLGTDTSMYIIEQDRNKLDKLKSYLSSTIVNYVLNILCQSSHANQTMKLFPDITDDIEIINDNSLFEYFNLTKDEENIVLNYNKK